MRQASLTVRAAAADDLGAINDVAWYEKPLGGELSC
jgi:hypothetical protein